MIYDNGLYVGVWMFNISWILDINLVVLVSFEVDVYGGWKLVFIDWFIGDIGVLYYVYFGSYLVGMIKFDIIEVYFGVDVKWIVFKYLYSIGNIFGNVDMCGSIYVDLLVMYEFFVGIIGLVYIGC